MPEEENLEALRLADEADQIGFARFLCERYLKDYPDHLETLLRYASNLISLAQYDLAKTTLDHAQAIAPAKGTPLVLHRFGHLLTAQGDFSGAEEAYLQAHGFDPSDATYLVFAGSVAFHSGDLDRAQRHARKATECPKGCIDEAYFNLGGYLLSAKRYHDAAACYLKALEMDPDYQIAKERLNDVELILKAEGK